MRVTGAVHAHGRSSPGHGRSSPAVCRRARRCSAGFVGSGDAPSEQSSPTCSGLCPRARYCLKGTIEPQPCTVGSYCAEGSPLPVPCKPGTFTESSNLTSQEECATCPAGSWCSGGLRIRCSAGSFNPHEGSFNPFACEQCPSAYATTRTAGATQLEQCECLPGYVHAEKSGTGWCKPCPPGASCDQIGTSIRRLLVLPGYYRPSSMSLDVRLLLGHLLIAS